MSQQEQKGEKSFSIAIVGGGIAGLTLAVALYQRNVPAILYERAARFEEIGAGVSFTPNAVQAMKLCHPGVYDAFESVCTRNGWESKRQIWFDFVNGSNTADLDLGFSVSTNLGQNGVHRANFLDELAKLLPPDRSRFGKEIEEIYQDKNGKMIMCFADGSSASADAVVGCDGIRSRVRQFVAGSTHPSVHPSYSYKYAYRGVVPMDEAIEAVGEEKARNATIYMGQDGHVLTFPVSHGQKLNIVAFRTSSSPWGGEKMTKMASRQDAMHDFASFHPKVLQLLQLTQEVLPVWAIYDLHDQPVPSFFNGRVCISGDAAHATSPHHGAGAGLCIEDSAVLAELLSDELVVGADDLEYVFAAFDQTRRSRCQWLVRSSRFVGDCYEWRAEGVGRDFEGIEREINERLGVISGFNLDEACAQAAANLHEMLKSSE